MNLKDNMINRTCFEDDEIIISTVKVTFLDWYGKYETAISFNNGYSWKIYEGYSTEKDARDGHERYKNLSKEQMLKLTPIG